MGWARRRLVLAMTAMALVACGGTAGSSFQDQANDSCPVSSGSGPVHLTGQSWWYAGGQVAVILVDATYRGRLLVRASQLGDSGTTITLAGENLPPAAAAGLAEKELQHGVQVVPATTLPQGGVELADAGPSPYSRAWYGYLSTSDSGCFAVRADGENFSEQIIFWVRPGTAPPG